MNIDSKKRNLIFDNLPHRFDVGEFEIRWSLEHKEWYAIQGHAGAKLPCPFAWAYNSNPILKDDENYGTFAITVEEEDKRLLRICSYKAHPNNFKELLGIMDFSILGAAYEWLRYFEESQTSEIRWRPQVLPLRICRNDYLGLVCEKVLPAISGKDFTHETETVDYPLPTRSFP